MFDSVKGLIEEHKAIQVELSDPAVHADAARAKKVNRRYAELSRIVAANDAWIEASADLDAAREFAKEDEAFAADLPEYRGEARRRSGAPAAAADPSRSG